MDLSSAAARPLSRGLRHNPSGPLSRPAHVAVPVAWRIELDRARSARLYDQPRVSPDTLQRSPLDRLAGRRLSGVA
jgi:hypothetical protein